MKHILRPTDKLV